MATYQTFAPNTYNTLGNWLLLMQFFGAGFTTCGWSAQTGHGELAATGTGATYAWTNPVLPTTALLAPQSYTFKGAFVPSATYVGGNTANLATECDVVTSAGITYVHITASSSAATVPASDATNWQPLFFEIWKSNGAQTASLPIFVKLVYTVGGATGIRVRFSIGTGVDVNGNITNPLPMSTVNPVWDFLYDAGTSNSTTLCECGFSGDADNFRFYTLRACATAALTGCLVVDRSKTASGADTNAFVYIGWVLDNANSGTVYSMIIANSSLSNAILSISRTGWAGVVYGGNAVSSMQAFGSAPVVPVFPLPGYLANPCLGVVAFHKIDGWTDGTQFPVWIYGASHNYIAITSMANPIDNQTNGMFAALLWE